MQASPASDATEGDASRGSPVAFPLLAGAVGFALAYLQPFGTSPDYPEYELFLSTLRESGLDFFTLTRFEPGFVSLCYALTLGVSSNLVIYSVLAAAAVSAKMAIVRALSPERLALGVAALFYASRYLALHELTQLRIALALALLLLAFVQRREGKLLASALACGASLLLHFSAALLAPFVLLRVRSRRDVIAIGIAEFVVVRFLIPLLVQRLTGQLEVLSMYEGQTMEVSRNVLALPVVLDTAMVLVSLMIWEELTEPMRRVIMLQVAGLVFFYGAADFPAFAHRVREAFSVFWVVYVAQGMSLRPPVRSLVLAFTAICVMLYGYLFFLRSDVPFFS